MNFQSLLEDASQIYLTQLKGDCVQNVNFWVTLTPRFDHFAYEIRLEIQEIIKLQLTI